MKINDLVTESELEEGPVLNKIGTAVGKGVGTAAKAAGAVAGGVAGLGAAIKKGYQAGKATVATGGDEGDETTLSPQVQKVLGALKQLSPADQKAAISALQNPKPAQPAAKTAPQPQAGINIKRGTAQDQGTGPTISKGVSAQTSKVVQSPANKAASDNYEKAKADVRKVQGGNKPIPPKNAQEIQADLAKLAKGDKESGAFAAKKIMQLANVGVDVSKVQQQWLANAKAGERFLTQSVYFELTKMLREFNLGWNDLGLRIRLVENTNDVVGVSFV